MRGIDDTCALDVAAERVAGVFEAGRESDEQAVGGAVRPVPARGGDAGPGRRRRGAGDRRRSSRRIRCSAPVPEAVRRSLVAELDDAEASRVALRRVRDG